MKVIIAGSRSIQPHIGDRLVSLAVGVAQVLDWDITEVVCGEARGIDSCGRRWAERHGVPVRSFPADWGMYGKRAGYMRNEQMAEYGEALIAITSGSPGTRQMISVARARKISVIVITLPEEAR